jgi:hypothetical protein
VRKARAVQSAESRDASRAELRAANAAARMHPTEAQLEAQLESFETERLLPLFTRMGEVGGPAVISFCLTLAEDEAQPKPRRRQGLARLQLLEPTAESPITDASRIRAPYCVASAGVEPRHAFERSDVST